MNVVLTAELAIFFLLNSARLGPTILGCGVSTLITILALQHYLLSWHNFSHSVNLLKKDIYFFLEPMTRLELVTSSLPRMRSTN